MNLDGVGLTDLYYPESTVERHVEQYPFSPCKKERMEYLTTAVLTALFTIVFLVIYKLVINPQIVFSPSPQNMSKCPDMWNYNSSTQMCEPYYDTTCKAFNPDVNTMKTAAAKCNVARMCNTTWSGFCS